MLKRIAALAVACIALSQLVGCVGLTRLKEITPKTLESQGVVLASVSRPDGLEHYSNYNLDLRPKTGDSVISLRVFDGHLGGRHIDVIEDGMVRSIVTDALPPGDYELFQIRVHTSNGYTSREWTFKPTHPVQIKVEAGKVYYLGAHVVLPKIRPNWAGIEGIWDPTYLPMMNVKGDTQLARTIYPNLPEIVVPDPVVGRVYDAMWILALTRTINPEKSYWSEEYWPMVKDLEMPDNDSEAESATE